MAEDAEIQIPLDDAPATPEVPPEDGIDALKAKLEAEKQRADSEAAGRQAAESRAAQAAGQAKDSNLSLVSNAIEMVKQGQSGLRDAYADALAAGDYGAAADIQMKMSEASAKLIELERGRERLKETPRPVAQTDPVEMLASQLTPQSAAWVRQHPEYARDPNKYLAMVGAHNVAVGKGLAVDSPAYFAEVERALDIGYSDAPRREAQTRTYDDPTGDAAQAVGGRRASPPAEAPVSRAPNGPGSGTRQGVVRLTASEVEMAENMGMSVEEYAKSKAALIKEGKMTH